MTYRLHCFALLKSCFEGVNFCSEKSWSTCVNNSRSSRVLWAAFIISATEKCFGAMWTEECIIHSITNETTFKIPSTNMTFKTSWFCVGRALLLLLLLRDLGIFAMRILADHKDKIILYFTKSQWKWKKQKKSHKIFPFSMIACWPHLTFRLMIP